MSNFQQNFREAFKDYTASSDKMNEFQKQLHSADVARHLRKSLGATLGTSGTAGMLGGWSAGPIPGLIGTALGAPLVAVGTAQQMKSDETYYDDKNKISKDMMKEANKLWRDYKNDVISKVTNGEYTVGKLAQEGKMVDDDGNIIDIDYDYYSTVSNDTLDSVFGEDGASAVRHAIAQRQR